MNGKLVPPLRAVHVSLFAAVECAALAASQYPFVYVDCWKISLCWLGLASSMKYSMLNQHNVVVMKLSF